jgi:hypothetical protein
MNVYQLLIYLNKPIKGTASLTWFIGQEIYNHQELRDAGIPANGLQTKSDLGRSAFVRRIQI